MEIFFVFNVSDDLFSIACAFRHLYCSGLFVVIFELLCHLIDLSFFCIQFYIEYRWILVKYYKKFFSWLFYLTKFVQLAVISVWFPETALYCFRYSFKKKLFFRIIQHTSNTKFRLAYCKKFITFKQIFSPTNAMPIDSTLNALNSLQLRVQRIKMDSFKLIGVYLKITST